MLSSGRSAAEPRCRQVMCAPGNAGIARLARTVPVDAGDVDGLLDLASREARRPDGGRPRTAARPGHRRSLFVARAADLRSDRRCRPARVQQGLRQGLHGADTAFRRPAIACATTRPRRRPCSPAASSGFPWSSRPTASPPARGSSSPRIGRTADAAIARGDGGAAVRRCRRSARARGVPRPGPEVSFFALCDGAPRRPVGSAQDHKRIFDGDQGPNTGGMGAFAPSPLVDRGAAARDHARDRRSGDRRACGARAMSTAAFSTSA